MLFSNRLILLVLLLPALVLLGFLAIWPICQLVAMAFLTGSSGISHARFVGLENFSYLFTDFLFWISIKNTILYSAASTSAEAALGLIIALLFNRQFLGRSLAIPIIILPFVLSTMVVASIWRAWFNYDFGFLNNVFAAVGLPRFAWLSSTSLALPSVIIMDVWQSTAIAFLIILAGLQSIPKDVIEASRVDGASGWMTFRTIILPLLRNYIALVLLLRTIDTFKIFDKIFVTTQGGPGVSTEVLSLYVYRQAFRFSDEGLASSSAIVMLLIGMAFAAFYWLLLLRHRIVR